MNKIKTTALEKLLHYAETPANGTVAVNEVEKVDEESPAEESASPVTEDSLPPGAYEETLLEALASEIADYCDAESDIAARFRELQFQRSKLLAAMQKPMANDRKQILERAVDIFDYELELIDMDLAHHERFSKESIQTSLKNKPTLYLIPGNRNLGIMGMAEILTALKLLGGIASTTGKEPTSVAFASILEEGFGFSFNDVHDCQTLLFKRQFCNLTKTLDAMKAALIKEYRMRQALKK